MPPDLRKGGLPYDHIFRAVPVLPCHHRTLRPVHSGIQKEVTAPGSNQGGYFFVTKLWGPNRLPTAPHLLGDPNPSGGFPMFSITALYGFVKPFPSGGSGFYLRRDLSDLAAETGISFQKHDISINRICQ